MSKIQLTVNHMDCDYYVVLTNDNGDTYTSKSEELIDFIRSSEDDEIPHATRSIPQITSFPKIK